MAIDANTASEASPEVLADPEALARRVADWLLATARAKVGLFAVALSGGSTPRRLYERLAGPPYREVFPWQRTHWFWGDERFVPHDHPDSNYRMAREALLSRAPVPAANVHPIPTEGIDPDDAAATYERALKAFYGARALEPERPLFDVTFLGLGPDGHTASLFPGTAILKERRRWVGAVMGVKAEPRITLTYPALESSRETVFLVAGEGKRAALEEVFRGDSELPAARLRPIGRLRFFVDRAAVGERREDVQTILVVMGVSGSGKTTIGRALAARLGWPFEEGDDLHPESDIAKMRAGIPLNDSDRWPWLDKVGEWIDGRRLAGKAGIITCSALKRRYRDLLARGRPEVRFLYLRGDRDLIATRLAARKGHFMPPSLLDSQFAILEEPQPDEQAIVVDVGRPAEDIVDDVLKHFGLVADQR